jgi:acetylglutamate kinase
MQLHLIKIGGNILDNPVAYEQALDDLTTLDGAKILVHGGGKLATQLSQKLHLEPNLIDGRRVTDAATLEVVVMVYAGLINKKIVAGLQARGENALGLTGADLNFIGSQKRKKGDIDYGFVGDIVKIDAKGIKKCLDDGIFPVFSPITHDGNGQLLNTNADTIAAQLAIALSPFYDVTLQLCFEQKGVLLDSKDENSVLLYLDSAKYAQLKANNSIHSGMLPKLENAFNALDQGVQKVIICHANQILGKNGTQLIV